MIFIIQIKKYGTFYGSEGLGLFTVSECASSENSERDARGTVAGNYYVCCELIELAHDSVQWRGLVLAVLNLRVLLPESQLISKMDLRETGCEDGR
jgi:hypothetical protein